MNEQVQKELKKIIINKDLELQLFSQLGAHPLKLSVEILQRIVTL